MPTVEPSQGSLYDNSQDMDRVTYEHRNQTGGCGDGDISRGMESVS
jgi:hypothetical protein